ncbi:MAG TPA: hypothetical protein VGG11_14560, partial [Xanthobacteraceae bacterium]
ALRHRRAYSSGITFLSTLPPSSYRPEISFGHGAEWNALISRYIETIPPNGEASPTVAQSISC